MTRVVTISAVVDGATVETKMRVDVLGRFYCLPVAHLPFDVLTASDLCVDGEPVVRGSCYEALSRPTILEARRVGG